MTNKQKRKDIEGVIKLDSEYHAKAKINIEKVEKALMTNKQKRKDIEKVLILDDFDRFLGILELKNWRDIETLKGFFFHLVRNENRWSIVFPSLAIKRNNLDIFNKLEIDAEVSFNELSPECVRVDIFGDEGVISLQLIAMNKVIKIKG